MKMLTRLAVIALLLGSVASTASAYAEDARACHLPPITGSPVSYTHLTLPTILRV